MTRSVLHVLPHRGHGNERYCDVLEAMDGYSAVRVALTARRQPLFAAPGIVARLPGLARSARSHDLVHVHGEVASLLCLPILRRRRFVVTLHGLHLLRRTRGPARRAVERAVRAIVASADRTICVSHAEREEVASIVPETTLERVATIRNGLPLPPSPAEHNRERARAALGLSDGTCAALFAGQLEERKDPGTAVAAAAGARDAGAPIELLVAGDGPLRAELERRAAPGVRILGHRDDVEALLAAADVFVLPSRREGLSYAVLEAMGQGLAIVASDGPGNPEAVGAAGVLVRTGDIDGFARVLARLASDPAERARLGGLARERVASEFAAEEMVRRTRELYNEVLGGP
jgi:glycogen(starch) synthase